MNTGRGENLNSTNSSSSSCIGAGTAGGVAGFGDVDLLGVALLGLGCALFGLGVGGTGLFGHVFGTFGFGGTSGFFAGCGSLDCAAGDLTVVVWGDGVFDWGFACGVGFADGFDCGTCFGWTGVFVGVIGSFPGILFSVVFVGDFFD